MWNMYKRFFYYSLQNVKLFANEDLRECSFFFSFLPIKAELASDCAESKYHRGKLWQGVVWSSAHCDYFEECYVAISII